MAITERGLEDICRLCAIESESCLPIYSQEGETLNLEQKIITCLHIKVSRSDLLPKKVCGTCSTLLEELHQFLCRAANAQQTLNFLFDLQLRQLQEQELGILQNVKLEGSLIKNELEDVNIHHTDQRVETRDMVPQGILSHLGVLPEDYQLTCHALSPVYNAAMSSKTKVDIINSFNEPSARSATEQNAIAEAEEPKQSHRRKMYQPKKTPERLDKGLVSGISGVDLDEVSLLQSSTADLHCLLNTRTEETGNSVQRFIENTGQRLQNSGTIHNSPAETATTVPEMSMNEEVQCLVAGEEVPAVDDLTNPEARDDDFGSVEFDEAELFEDLEDEDEEVDVKPPVANTLALKRDWNIVCDKCSGVFPHRAQFDTHYRNTHGAKPVYTCAHCGKLISNFSSFRNHVYRHDSKYPCVYCEKIFKMESLLRAHVLSKHVTERPFICDSCGKGYVSQYRLNVHKKQHLSQNPEYRCTFCDKVLRTKNGLSCHMSAHRLGRQFMCDLCGKTFTQKVNMLQHVKFHKGERPFACEICNKRFAERSHLNRHKLFHSMERPFQCTVCLKMYKTERCLKVHSRVHLVTRPYVCPECGKGFLNVTKLKQHYHCHTGERPYACKYCERTFTNYPNWLKHTRRRHKVDHKTGMKLEQEAPPPDPTLQHSDSLPELDDFAMADVKVKDDGGDATLLLSPSIFTQFHVSADLAHLQLPDSQLLHYHDHLPMLPL